MGLDYSREFDPSKLIRDTRSTGEKFADMLKKPEFTFIASGVTAAFGFVFPSATEIFCAASVATCLVSRYLISNVALPLRLPKSSGLKDPNERHPKTKLKQPAKGIIYLGNEQETGDELWMTDSMARTHMLFMGTTGAGKTEYLLSLVYNSLIHASGFIYIDGKADSTLYGKIYSMARMFGREQDVLVVNFQTGAKDIFGPQSTKMSNTMNPYAVGSSGMLAQLTISLMSTGKSDVWENRAISFIEALMKPLVFLRDNYGLLLDVCVIRDFFVLPKVEELAWRMSEQYPGLEQTLDGLKSYLDNLPAYDRAKYQQQGETTNEQHGFITMQLVRTFNSLADTYGYIMRTPLAEIDFLDVFLNRRILVVLLPALEKAPAELTNLGRIIVAAVKATMAVGLGAKLEGSWKKVIQSKPTTSPSPFECVMDEYGYYAVEGFAVVPAQARSLGFSAVFAGQDLPAFQKASEKEAESTAANTNTKLCGKMTCTKTYKYFADLAGHGYYTRTGGYVDDKSSSIMGGRNYRDGDHASIEKFERVSFDALQKQTIGKWHLFSEGKIIRVDSFYADFEDHKRHVGELRVNRFLRVRRPDTHEVSLFRQASTTLAGIMASERGFNGAIDTFPDRDLAMLSDAFESTRAQHRDVVEHVLATFATVQEADGVNEDAMGDLLGAYIGDGSFDGELGGTSPEASGASFAVGGAQGGFDFVSSMTGYSAPRADDWSQAASGGSSAPSPIRQALQTLGDQALEDWSRIADADIPEYKGAYDVGAVDESFVREAESYSAPDEGKYDEVPIPQMGFESLGSASGAVEGLFSPAEGPISKFESGEIAGLSAYAASASGEQGFLQRDFTQMAIADIQRRLGDTDTEASLAASVTVGQMAQATHYPVRPPAKPSTPEDFIQIATKVSHAFASLDELVREGATR